jgi:hypothetical protein
MPNRNWDSLARAAPDDVMEAVADNLKLVVPRESGAPSKRQRCRFKSLGDVYWIVRFRGR